MSSLLDHLARSSDGAARVPLTRFGLPTLRGLWQLDQNLKSHFPEQPCWYLAALGVDPDHQGKGVGSHLRRTVLQQIDQRREPAYLKTAEEPNVRFYERLDFEVRQPAVQMAPPTGPTHWTMWRDPE